MRRQYVLRLVSRAGWRACSILAVQMQMQSGVLLGSGVRLLGILQPAFDPVVRGSLHCWHLYICCEGHLVSWPPSHFYVHMCRLSVLQHARRAHARGPARHCNMLDAKCKWVCWHLRHLMRRLSSC